MIARARARGITSIITNGLNPSDNEAVRALAARVPEVRPAFGLYPVDAVLTEMEAMGCDYARDCPPFSGEEGVQWVRDHASEAFAIGEIGLDGYWVPEALWERQEELFRSLVEIAIEADKALIVHTRKRERRALEILLEMGAERVVWHCFGGRLKLARAIAERGHWLSIPANARRNEAFRRMLETLPRERILLETDCPYLGPVPKERNEPANVDHTAAFAAELWGEPPEEVERILAGNYEAVFGEAP